MPTLEKWVKEIERKVNENFNFRTTTSREREGFYEKINLTLAKLWKTSLATNSLHYSVKLDLIINTSITTYTN
jgi:hypothetical protein